MADELKASGGGSATDAAAPKVFVLTRKQLFVRLVGAALVGAALGASAALAVKALVSDEPPIRVRGGSIHLELLGSKSWKYNSGQNYWFIPWTGKDYELYDLLISTTAPASCESTLSHKGKVLRFTHSDGNWVQLDSTGRRTKVTANVALSASADMKTLTLGGDGYLAGISVDGTSVCRFGDAEFNGAVVTDP